MSDIITATSAAMEIVSKLRNLNKKIANAEFSTAVANLSIELADIKVKVASLAEENDQLKRKLSERNSADLEFKEFAYFSREGDGPFCSGCYDNSKKVVRLSKEGAAFQIFGSHSCPVCRQPYGST